VISKAFFILHRWGKSERSIDITSLELLVEELDSPQSASDDEHVSVSVRLPNGCSISAYRSGLVLFENVEDLSVDPRHIRVKSRKEARELMELLVSDKRQELEQQRWEIGNG
jgi:hypothetical protein